MSRFGPEHGFDGGLHRRLRFRKVRRAALFLVGLACFFEFAGVPHLRFQPERRPAYYVGPTGVRSPLPGRLPLIVLLPLSRSLLDYGQDAFSAFVALLKDGDRWTN